MKRVAVERKVLSENDRIAGQLRERFCAHDVVCLNLISSPGAGKTSLLERTLEGFPTGERVAVLTGDIQTDHDATRLARFGFPVRQITTGGACHLDAHLVHAALHEIRLRDVDVLFIENVGNLVCPATFDLGQHRNVALLSHTEGDDKPAKYPVLFRTADLVLLTKSDLAPHLDDFDAARAERCVRALANPAPVFALSARRGAGMRPWLDWIRAEFEAARHKQHGEERAHDQREAMAR